MSASGQKQNPNPSFRGSRSENPEPRGCKRAFAPGFRIAPRRASGMTMVVEGLVPSPG